MNGPISIKNNIIGTTIVMGQKCSISSISFL